MENRRTKTILLSCFVLLVLACICLGLVLTGALGVSMIWPFQSGKQENIPTPIVEMESPQESVQDSPPESVQETPPESLGNAPEEPSKDLPGELIEIIDEIESQVTQIRGLAPIESVERTLISSEELEEIVVNDFFSEYTDQEAQQDVLILSALGLLPGGFDLKNFYNQLYSEQIAGFYDDETKEIYVVKGVDFGGNEKLTYAHEFTHVLQDQIYGLQDGLGLNDESCEADSERCAAVQALIEGDATQTEILWFQTYASFDDYKDILQSYEAFESPILDSAPTYMAADLLFPYEKGYDFVVYLYDQGDFAAVDEAYRNPPLSTEQILHPEKYPDDLPITVTLPDLSRFLDDGWALYDQNVMGEWYTFMILNKAHEEAYQLSEEIANEAAAGWGGDAYAFYLNENTDEVVFILDSTWDTIDDAEAFAEAFLDYASLRWAESTELVLGLETWRGADTTVAFLLAEDRTLWVMGPSDQIVETILLELQ